MIPHARALSTPLTGNEQWAGGALGRQACSREHDRATPSHDNRRIITHAIALSLHSSSSSSLRGLRAKRKSCPLTHFAAATHAHTQSSQTVHFPESRASSTQTPAPASKPSSPHPLGATKTSHLSGWNTCSTLAPMYSSALHSLRLRPACESPLPVANPHSKTRLPSRGCTGYWRGSTSVRWFQHSSSLPKIQAGRRRDVRLCTCMVHLRASWRRRRGDGYHALVTGTVIE